MTAANILPTPPPFFTVVIPTYKRPDMLAEAIQSVLAQTFTDFELFVIDDHSPDNTADVVASFTDPRLHYLLNERSKGASGARNTGIFRARGQWIAFQDDDDIWLPDKLQEQFAKIQSVGLEVGVIYTGYTSEAPNGSVVTILPEKEGSLLQELLYKNYIGGFSMVAIRKDLLHAVNGLDERFPAMQDLELYIALAQFTEVAVLKQPLVRVQRGHMTRISTNWQNKLTASQLLYDKYQHLYAKSWRLRHRVASRIFVFAWLNGDKVSVGQNFWMTLSGLLVDIKNIGWVIRMLARNLKKSAQN